MRAEERNVLSLFLKEEIVAVFHILWEVVPDVRTGVEERVKDRISALEASRFEYACV